MSLLADSRGTESLQEAAGHWPCGQTRGPGPSISTPQLCCPPGHLWGGLLQTPRHSTRCPVQSSGLCRGKIREEPPCATPSGWYWLRLVTSPHPGSGTKEGRRDPSSWGPNPRKEMERWDGVRWKRKQRGRRLKPARGAGGGWGGSLVYALAAQLDTSTRPRAPVSCPTSAD